jgi:hypothetical protein
MYVLPSWRRTTQLSRVRPMAPCDVDAALGLLHRRARTEVPRRARVDDLAQVRLASPEFHARALTRGSNLVLCALFNTLHSAAYTGAGAGHGMRRERLFALAFVGAGIWGASALVRTQCGVVLTAEVLALFPSYLFSALRCAGWKSCAREVS